MSHCVARNILSCMLLNVVLFPECPRPSDPLPLISHALGSACDCSMIHSLSFHAFHEYVQSFCVALLAHGDFLLLKLYYICTHITGISLQFGCSCNVLFGDSDSLGNLG